MPELPEVETVRRGITPYVVSQDIADVIIRQRRLRWPVPAGLGKRLRGQTVLSLRRRAKYLLFETQSGTLILHLGMSGSLRIVDRNVAAGKHDHFDLILANGCCLRLTDPRRFGSLHWTTRAADQHWLLRDLGPEPFDDRFDGAYLYACAQRRRLAVKNFIMDSRIVAGLGNIYASESLFAAGIHPARRAGRIALRRYETLADAVRTVLQSAIGAGGTTLRDFVDSSGRPGYFMQALNVYGRSGEACPQCKTPIYKKVIGQRASFYCPRCQT